MRNLAPWLLIALTVPAWADPPQVLVSDYGVKTGVIGPGAPTHTVGLQAHHQLIVMDTGVKDYGLLYCVATDEKRPGVAIPGEGYIGMPQPSGCNWYHGGFFDLQINGQSIGPTPAYSVTGRSTGERGYVDFVFDAPQAIVRIRFSAVAGGDALYAQALLEPKQEIKTVRVSVRCYPSAFVSNADRHVLTPVRDIPQGERAELDLAKEWWLLYYDRIFDAGYVSPAATGVGPCSVLWPGSQTDKVFFTVGSYGIDTHMDLKPQLRDFRWVFIDYEGTKNEAATADLRARADTLLSELATYPFTDPGISGWPLAQKQAEIKQVLAGIADEQQTAANYEQWAAQLAEQLKLVQTGAPGAIMAEATAAKLIQQWEQGLPEIKLRALLKEI